MKVDVKKKIRSFLRRLTDAKKIENMNIFSKDPDNRVKLLNIVQNLSVCFSLSVPDLYNYRGLPIMYIGYSVFLCLFLVVILALTLVDIWLEFKKSLALLILESLSLIFVTVDNVGCILFSVLWGRRKMLSLITMMQRIENGFTQLSQIRELLVIHIMVIVFGTLVMIILNSAGSYSVWRNFALNFNVFLALVSILQYTIYTSIINNNFKMLNEKLETIFESYKKDQQETTGISMKNKISVSLRMMTNIIEAIDYANAVYDVRIRGFFLIFLLMTVWKLNEVMDVDSSSEDMAVLVCNIFMYQILNAVVVHPSHELVFHVEDAISAIRKVIIISSSGMELHDLNENELLWAFRLLHARTFTYTPVGWIFGNHPSVPMILYYIAIYVMVKICINS
ncbi:hypothetical protein HHI36_021072 [Cryptolaemus montrouzieri]|uniref:Gustatory receptor n=1 Tax=Cryptolaemus montrouzieri TaxID=559131 RepID=A0ABD2MVT8_9CUCU